MTDETAPSRPTTMLATAAAFVIVVAGMRAAEPIIVPFLLSVFLAVIAAPPMFWLEAKGLPRWLAMLSVVALILAVGTGITALVGNSLNEFTGDIPGYKARLTEQAGAVVSWIEARGVDVSRERLLSLVNPGKAIELAGNVFDGFGSVLTNAFLIFLTVVFVLFEAHSFPAKVRAIVKDPERSLGYFEQFTSNLERYLAIKTVTSIGTGVCIGSWLAVLGVDYPVLWGILAFLLNYVPNIGSIIAAIPAVLLALVQIGPATAAWAAVGYAVVNVFFGNFLEPRFMGKRLGLSTLVVFLSLVFWGWLLGPVGMFLSVPLTMTAKIALDASEETRWLAVLLGPEEAASATIADTRADRERAGEAPGFEAAANEDESSEPGENRE